MPGPSSLTAALSISGLPTDAFVFTGFLARKKEKRAGQLARLEAEDKTLVFFESPRRVGAFLDEIGLVMGDRPAVLAREMTKLHEEFIRGSLSEIQARLAGRPAVKGECTLLVEGTPTADSASDTDLAEALRDALAQPGAHVSSLTKVFARQYRLPRKTVYEMALKIQKEANPSS